MSTYLGRPVEILKDHGNGITRVKFLDCGPAILQHTLPGESTAEYWARIDSHGVLDVATDRIEPDGVSDLLPLAMAHAAKLGERNGKSAASWVFDGNTTTETYRAILAGIEDGDPMVLDSLPQPEDYLLPILNDSLETAGIPADDVTDEIEREILEAYELAYGQAVSDEVTRVASEMLED